MRTNAVVHREETTHTCSQPQIVLRVHFKEQFLFSLNSLFPSAVLRKHHLSRGLLGVTNKPIVHPQRGLSQHTSQAAARFLENLPADVNTSPGKYAAWPLTRRNHRDEPSRAQDVRADVNDPAGESGRAELFAVLTSDIRRFGGDFFLFLTVN